MKPLHDDVLSLSMEVLDLIKTVNIVFFSWGHKILRSI